MSSGRIKDPDGKQARYGWGYIQRTESATMSNGQLVSLNWEDTLKPKVIPFYNDGRWKLGQLVYFNVDSIEGVTDPNDSKKVGPLAVATNLINEDDYCEMSEEERKEKKY